MRRAVFSFLIALMPGAACAEDILARADIASAIVYAAGGDVVRRVTVDLPEGASRITLPMRDVAWADRLAVTAPEGVIAGAPRAIDRITLAEGGLDTPREAEARARVAAARAALVAIQDEQAGLDARIAGLEAQLAYLRAVAEGGAEGARLPDDPAMLGAVLAGLGTETTRVATDLQAERIARRGFADRLAAAETALRGAEAALARLQPLGTEHPGITFEVMSDAARQATFEIAYLTPDLSWRPRYTLSLETGTGRLTIARRIAVGYDGPAPWRDVAMVFSTADPTRRAEPSWVGPNPVRMAPPPEPANLVRAETADAMPAPVIAAEPMADLRISGVSVRYDYGPAVSLRSGDVTVLPFDAVRVDMAIRHRAVPRRDDTAYVIARGRNTTGEPILPGEAVLYRDGDLVADTYLDLIPAGGEMTLAFGPVDHLLLSWQDLSRDTGDRGVFVTSNEERRVVVFGVENTSVAPETVRVVYATPFSEDDDLSVDVTLSDAPDERDLDGDRGVHAWDLTLAAGERREIEMTVDLAWPEDMDVVWQP